MTLWDRIFLGSEEVERGAAADKKLAELNRQAYETGLWNEAQYAQAETNRLNNAAETYGRQIGDAFTEGAKEGLAKAQEAVKGTVGTVTGGALGFVPWYVWLLGAAWLALQLGVLKLPKR